MMEADFTQTFLQYNNDKDNIMEDFLQSDGLEIVKSGTIDKGDDVFDLDISSSLYLQLFNTFLNTEKGASRFEMSYEKLCDSVVIPERKKKKSRAKLNIKNTKKKNKKNSKKLAKENFFQIEEVTALQVFGKLTMS